MNITNLRIYFALSVLGLLTISSCTNTPESTSTPNVIIIFTDDLGYGDLACYGHPTIATPHLDQMAQEGLRFTQFYSGASVCTPSRAALLTGRLPIRFGLADKKNRVFFPWSLSGIPQEEVTMAEMLKSKGYNTAMYGKWHLGHLEDYLPLQHGFDEYYGIPYSNDMSPEYTTWEPAKAVLPPTPLYEGNKVIELEPDQSKLTPEYTRRSIDFIKRNKDNPFFLYLPHTFPHVPLFASEKFDGKSTRGLYGDVVEEIDWSIGQILKTLKEEGLDENTLVVFTSDNGPWLTMNEEGGSAGLLHQGKGSTFEGGMRVPMIARWPGKIVAAKRTAALGTMMDLYKTVANICNVSTQNTMGEDGIDLSPVLFAKAESVRDEVFYYLGEELYAYRNADYKIHYKTLNAYVGEQAVSHDPPLLYNLSIDPSEKYNIAAKMPEKIAQMNALVKVHKDGVTEVPSRLALIDSVMLAPLLKQL